MPELTGAANDAKTGKSIVAAFDTVSPVKRPVEARKHSPNSALFSEAMPIALSTAL